MLKVGSAALFTQPFVHICGSRYWTTAAPLFALAAALAWGVWVSARRGDRETGGPGDRPWSGGSRGRRLP